MEESEKRKERLKAIREEAAEGGDNNEEQNSIRGALDHGLTNPLIETPSASFGKDEPRPRFDYYTDPMAAFSANSDKNNLSPQVSQPCNTPPRPLSAGSPAYHAQGNYNSAKRPYQPRGVNAIPLGIRRKTSPFCTPPGNSSNTSDSSLGTPNNTLCLSHRKLVIFPVMAFLKEVELAVPTKVQDPKAGLTEVQEEAGVDSSFTITSQWWKTRGKP